MVFDVAQLDAQQNYQLLIGGITPRPIAWISTRSKEGVDNLAPYSFFTVASCNPPVLLYTQVTQRSGNNKDTLQNLLETKECVVNIVNSALLEQMNATSAALGIKESEFSFANVEACESAQVLTKSVKNAPVRYECRLREVVRVSDLPAGGQLILLDVTGIYVDDALYKNDTIDQQDIDSVGKMGGNHFSLTTNTIELTRP
ncbi:flavin reductase family protein [Candidatus Njordibacter sp. Uisw_002]|jgi:flavin reductase (DIM6/NTAB) family NADH-FMN oxidoreductase RutF|uniref:flavin reductase family protein n=1 Tax=Candidatus Njordibacter sp. Uisw_002 TaxID=3230971 RepID=UPI003D4F061F|tara:strand:- start:156 stop:758 length:603 start_codon:yes stop_codon:yes gene_type:complete